MKISLTRAGLRHPDICSIAQQDWDVELSDAARDGIARAHECLVRHAGSGEAIYGVSTALGAGVDTRMVPTAGAEQHRVPIARAVGVGPVAGRAEVRAMIAARLARAAIGHSGMSPEMAEALAKLLNHKIHPLVPMLGSIGDADLPPLAHIGSVLTGKGSAELPDGRVLTGAEAFAEVGIGMPAFGLKDGLALVSSNAATLGLASLALGEVHNVIEAHVAAIALSCEGFRASLAPFAEAAGRLRSAPGQREVSAEVRRFLAGGTLMQPGAARRLQDPISLRAAPSVAGAALDAVRRAAEAVDLELASSDDNPAVLADEDRILPNGNFDPTHLALAFDLLDLALARLAAMAGERIAKLISPATSDLPRFLVKPGTPATGFGPMQKTVAALIAEIAHDAQPMPFSTLPVSDRIEDYASLAFSVVLKSRRIIGHLRHLTAIECIIAAQAVELREDIRLGTGTGLLLGRIREIVAPMEDDRLMSPDIIALADAITGAGLIGNAQLFTQPSA